MLDEHFYRDPDWFFENATRYDAVPRDRGYDLYVGEFACNRGVGSGNLRAALSEAAFMMGMERNGDLVKLCSYAPLFFNVNDIKWPVNMIGFDNAVVVRPDQLPRAEALRHEPAGREPADRRPLRTGSPPRRPRRTAAAPASARGRPRWSTRTPCLSTPPGRRRRSMRRMDPRRGRVEGGRRRAAARRDRNRGSAGSSRRPRRRSATP